MELFTFVDLVDPDSEEIFAVRASFRLLSTEEGGRKSWVRSGYRPNHNFGGPDNRMFYIGQIQTEGDRAIEPGESADVIIRFIPGRALNENLTIGRKWRIQEGGRQVGEATVLEVLNET